MYAGAVIGIAGKIDQVGDHLNSWNLLCYTCNPEIKIIPISKHEYFKVRDLVQLTLGYAA